MSHSNNRTIYNSQHARQAKLCYLSSNFPSVALIIILCLISCVQSSPCLQAPFPKVIGGSSDITVLYNIDYNSITQAVAVVGKTQSNDIRVEMLAGETPIIVKYSGGNMDYQWGKAIGLPISVSARGLAFSTNGALLITIMSSRFIMIIDSSNGNLINGFTFALPDDYDFYTKNILIDSNGKAYIQKQEQNTGKNRLFSFQARTFSSTPTWALETSLNLTPLGLVFGSSESNLLSLTQDSTIQRLTKLDSLGTVIWQAKLTFNNLNTNTLVASKALTATQSVIIVATGQLTFARILLDSNSFLESDTYTDAAYSGMTIRALYLIDSYNIIALLSAQSFNGYPEQTLLTLVNFQSKKISYKQTLPSIIQDRLKWGVFISPSKFLITTYQQTLFKDTLNTQATFSNQQGMIFTSEVSESSQTMYQVAEILGTMTKSSDFFTLESASLFSNLSGLTLTDESTVILMTDLINNSFTPISSWSKQKPYTLSNGASQSFSIKAGTSQTFTITQFIESLVCDTTLTKSSITYSGINLPTFASIDPTTGSISVTTSGKVGTYQFYISASNGIVSAMQYYTIVCDNQPAVFSSDPTNQIVPLNSLGVYKLPSQSDPEGEAFTISTTYQGNTLPSFIIFASDTYTIMPNVDSQIGSYIIDVILTDSYSLQTAKQFTVTITNTAPYFLTADLPLLDVEIKMNDLKSDYHLPMPQDAEGNSLGITVTNLPTSFVTYNTGTRYFTMHPTLFSQVGIHIVFVIVSDGQPLSNAYSFKITVTNTAPYLASSPIDQIVAMNSVLPYQLPTFQDLEGNPITIQSTLLFPGFYQYETITRTITFSPTLFTQVGDSTITFYLYDGQLQSPNYSFKVTVTNSAPLFSNGVTTLLDQTVDFQNSKEFVLPLYADPENNLVTISISNDYMFLSVSADNLKIIMYPTAGLQVGTFQTKIKLSDGQPFYTEYDLKVTVLNTAPSFTQSVLADQTLTYMQTFDYLLPTFSDPEGNAVSISINSDPGFLTLSADKTKITMNPTLAAHVGTFTALIVVSDAQPLSTNYNLKITVTNTPPTFHTTLSDQILTINQAQEYLLPAYSDLESNVVTVSFIGMPSFVTFDSLNNKLILTPVLAADIGDFTFLITLSDPQPLKIDYQLKVTVTNTAPIFSQAILTEQILKVYDIVSYTLPGIIDEDLSTCVVTIVGNPTWVQLNGMIVKIDANSLSFIGDITVKIIITDLQPLSTSYDLLIKVQNQAPVFSTALVDQSCPLNNLLCKYSLPSSSDFEGHGITISLSSTLSAILKIDNIFGPKISIFSSNFLDVADYTINVILTDDYLPDPKSTVYPLKISITNSAPVFNILPLPDQTLQVSGSKQYTLPGYADAEGHAITISIVGAPGFITLTNDVINMSPNSVFSYVGEHNFQVVLKDGQPLSNSYNLKVTVTNTAPTFAVKTLPDQTVMYRNQLIYSLPMITDLEGNMVTISIQNQPEFVTYSAAKITFSPTLAAHVNTFTFNVIIEDGQPLISTYPLKVIVTNTAPSFKISSLPSQSVKLNGYLEYVLPSFSDLESNTVTISIQDEPIFILLVAQSKITISPTDFAHTGTHVIKVILQDEQPMSREYLLTIFVTNSAPEFLEPILDQTIKLNDVKTYLIPSPYDNEGNIVTVTIAYQPVFVELIDEIKIKMSPTQFTDVGIHPFTITLTDGQGLKTDYPIAITVTNTSPHFIKETLPGQTVKLNFLKIYTLPQYTDLEGNDVTATISDNPYFVTQVTGFQLQFLPVQLTDFGLTTIKVTLSDGQPLAKTYELNITVTNDPPIFMVPKLQEFNAYLNVLNEFTLPEIYDGNHHKVTVSAVQKSQLTLPIWGNYDPDTLKIYFTPTLMQELGEYIVTISLFDGISLVSYDLPVIVSEFKFPNRAPFFQEELPAFLSFKANVISYFKLPAIYDSENDPFSMQVSLGSTFLFTTFDNKTQTFKLKPSEAQVSSSQYTITIVLRDYNDEPQSKTYQLKFLILTSKAASTIKGLPNSGKNNFSESIVDCVATMRLQKATREGSVKVRFYTREASQASNYIAQMINEEDIKFTLRQETGTQKVEFKIQNANTTSDGTIDIKLLFKAPQNVSSGTDIDFLEIVLQRDIIFEIGKWRFKVFKGAKFNVQMPSQSSQSQIMLAEKLSDTSQILQLALLPSSIFINIFIQLFIYLLWNFLNDLSVLMNMSMIALNVPGIAKLIQAILLRFIYMDILQTDKWLIQFFETKEAWTSDKGELLEDMSLSTFFEDSGFQSMSIVKNLGSTLVYLSIYASAFSCLIFLYILGMCTTKSEKAYSWLTKKLMWNNCIRFVIQQSQPMVISSLINFYDINFKSEITMASSILSIACFTGIIASIITMINVISIAKQNRILHTSQFLSIYGTLTEGLNLTSKIGLYWNPLVLTRWTLQGVILVAFRLHYDAQIMSLLGLSIIMQVLILHGSPLREIGENRMLMFNEIMISIYLYLLISLTEYNHVNPLREQCGLALLGVVIFTIGVNLLKLVSSIKEVASKMLSQRRKKQSINGQLTKKINAIFKPGKLNVIPIQPLDITPKIQKKNTFKSVTKINKMIDLSRQIEEEFKVDIPPDPFNFNSYESEEIDKTLWNQEPSVDDFLKNDNMIQMQSEIVEIPIPNIPMITIPEGVNNCLLDEEDMNGVTDIASGNNVSLY